MRSRSIMLMAACLLATNMYAAGVVKLHGKITNPISDSIYVRFTEDWLDYEPKAFGTRLSPNGSFSISFPLENNYTLVSITHGAQGTELAPTAGDDLTLTVDGNNFDSSVHYEGKGAPIANFMAKHILNMGFIEQFGMKTDKASWSGPGKIETDLNGQMQIELDFLNANGKNLPASFKQFWKAMFQYEVYYAMQMYPTNHEMKKFGNYDSRKIAKDDYAVLLKVPAVFDDRFLVIGAYKIYIGMYYRERLNALAAIDSTKKKNGFSLDDVNMAYKNMPAKTGEVFGAEDIAIKLEVCTVPQLDELMKLFKSRYPHSKYLPSLEKKMALKRNIGMGKMAPDFSFTTADDQAIKLSDLKGKVVYLDFWASWCAPCISEMRFSKKLEEKYKNRDVVFLYVSIDEDEIAWKKAIDKLQLNGFYTRSSEIAKLYGAFDNIPSYFLIDKDGHFALDATPSPGSDNTITEAIDKLLK